MSFVRIELPSMELRIDAAAIVEELNRSTAEHFARSFLAGRTPDGGALPRNKKGRPMGVGSGTIATRWERSATSGDASQAIADNGPYMEGGYYYAVQRLLDAGADIVSTEGQTDALISRIVSLAADRAVEL
jgi:hypothetical protein